VARDAFNALIRCSRELSGFAPYQRVERSWRGIETTPLELVERARFGTRHPTVLTTSPIEPRRAIAAKPPSRRQDRARICREERSNQVLNGGERSAQGPVTGGIKRGSSTQKAARPALPQVAAERRPSASVIVMAARDHAPSTSARSMQSAQSALLIWPP
jgi:hypothetical protein